MAEQFDQAMVERLTVAACDSFESRPEDFRGAVRAVLAALSQTHLIVPRNSGEERNAAADLAMCEAARPGPWEVRNDNEDTGYPPFWVIGKDVDEDSEEAMELHVGEYLTAVCIAESRTALPYWVKRCLEAEALVRLVRENNVLEGICEDNCGYSYGSVECKADDRCSSIREIRRAFDKETTSAPTGFESIIHSVDPAAQINVEFHVLPGCLKERYAPDAQRIVNALIEKYGGFSGNVTGAIRLFVNVDGKLVTFDVHHWHREEASPHA